MKLYAKIGDLGIKVPAHLEDSCKPTNHYRTKYNHDFEEGPYTCSHCEEVTTLGQMKRILGGPRCGSCGKYLPRLCSADGCDTFVPSFGEPDYWCEPWPFCRACLNEEARTEREAVLQLIPQRIRHAAVKGWEGRYEHRKKAGAAMAEWIDCKLGYEGGPSTLYLYGNVGSGKTTLAARAATKAVTDGIVADLLWVKEFDAINAAKSQYSREEAAQLIENMSHTALLIYDEMWSAAGSYTEHVKSTLTSIFSLRFEEGRPTIITSNEPPLWLQVLDTRVDSRFNGCARTIEVRGPDLRDGE